MVVDHFVVAFLVEVDSLVVVDLFVVVDIDPLVDKKVHQLFQFEECTYFVGHSFLVVEEDNLEFVVDLLLFPTVSFEKKMTW